MEQLSGLFGGGGGGKEFGRSSAETTIYGRDFGGGGGLGDSGMWVVMFGVGVVALVVVLAIKLVKD